MEEMRKAESGMKKEAEDAVGLECHLDRKGEIFQRLQAQDFSLRSK